MRPFQRARMGWEALLEGQAGSGDHTDGLGEVGRPARRYGCIWEALPGLQEALPRLRVESGGPPKESGGPPGRSGGPPGGLEGSEGHPGGPRGIGRPWQRTRRSFWRSGQGR